MPGRFGVFDQKNVASREGAGFSRARFNADCALEQDEELSLRRRVPIEVVVSTGFAEDHTLNGVKSGERTDVTLAVNGHIEIIESTSTIG